jgi:hypothetical protein
MRRGRRVSSGEVLALIVIGAVIGYAVWKLVQSM